MRIVAISGSLRAASSNTRLLRAAVALAPLGVEASLYDGLGLLPHFSPDRDTEPAQAAVANLRQQIASADGLLMCVPEYAHGLPGSFKNLLDWLVSSGEMDGLPVALLNTAPRSVHAQGQLREVVKTMNAILVPGETVAISLAANVGEPETLAADPAIAGVLQQVFEALREAINAGR